MLIRIDAGRLTNAVGLHTALGEAVGFASGYGKNLDALVDGLTHLDDPMSNMSRVQVFPGQVILLVIEKTQGMSPQVASQVQALTDAVAFVNWRRLEQKQPPVLAVAYQPE